MEGRWAGLVCRTVFAQAGSAYLARPSLCCLSLVAGFLYFVAPAAFEGPSVVCPEFAWNEDPLLVLGRGVRMGTRGLYLLPFCYFNACVM